MTDAPSLDRLLETRTRSFFGHPSVLPSFLGIFRIFTIALLVVAAVFATIPVLAAIIVAAACFIISVGYSSHDRWQDATRTGLRTIRFFFIFSSIGRLFLALGTALSGREFLGHGGLGHLAVAGGVVLTSLLLYTFSLIPEATAIPMDAVAPEPLGVRAEYDRLNDELVGLGRREREIADRKTELERHPDINRA